MLRGATGFLDGIVAVQKVKDILGNSALPLDDRHVFLVTGLAVGEGDKGTLSRSESSHNEASVRVHAKGILSAGPSAENDDASKTKTSGTIKAPRLMAFRVLKIGLNDTGQVVSQQVRGDFYAKKPPSTAGALPSLSRLKRMPLPLADSDLVVAGQSKVDDKVRVIDALSEDGGDCYLVMNVLPDRPTRKKETGGHRSDGAEQAEASAPKE